MQELDEELLEPFPIDGLQAPLIKLTLEPDPPHAQVVVGKLAYQYDCSYPIKGYSAVMPGYIKEQMAAGKLPLILERASRYYVYFAI
jgi:hypothetical protein